MNAGKVTILILTALLLFSGSVAQAQRKVELQEADSTYGGVRDGVRYRNVVGKVKFVQNETIIYCDTAIMYPENNRIEARSNVRILEGDSVTIVAGQLIYEGNEKIAQLRRNVVFTKLGQVTLYTDNLDYDRIQQEARYFQGGKLVDSTNVLTSEKGYYQVNTGMASFKRNVVGVNPDYTLKSDTLQYSTQTNIIYFRAPTELTDAEGNIFEYDQGQYDTRMKSSDLRLGEVETRSYFINAKRMLLDDLRKYYLGKEQIHLVSKEENVIIDGDDGYYDKANGVAKVYGNAVMKRPMGEDTLYMRADTLVAIENEDPSKERILAYPNVRIYKNDLQGRSDSLAYMNADSMIVFYSDPVLWTGENQITADTIEVEIHDNSIDKMYLTFNSFVVSRDSINNYNQIKGRDMIARFRESAISRVDVDGNAESLFYALDETESYLMGMNKSISSSMRIHFKLNKADNVSFFVKPDAHMIPPHELTADVQRLPGFSWRIEERPAKKDVLRSEDLIPTDQPPEKPVQKKPRLNNSPGPEKK